MLDVLAGAFLVALGGLVIYFLGAKSEVSDKKVAALALLGLACVVAGGWIILTKVTLFVLLVKVAGLLMAVVGFFLTARFPDVNEYQRDDMGKTGILFGLVLLIFGAYLLFFY